MPKGPLLPGIYTITNTLTGRIYVGQTARTFRIRWENHLSALNLGKHTAVRLRRSWARDGADAFVFAVQEIVPCPPGMSAIDYRQLLCDREQHWIDTLGAYGPKGFNVAPVAGSSLGHKHSAETRANMSLGQRKRGPVTAETRAKLSAVRKGKPKSPEHTAKISAAQKGKPRMYVTALNKARVWTPEARSRVGDMFAPWAGNRKGAKSSDGTRAKLRAAWQRRRRVDSQTSLPGL
jgi:group I intron endonuclease